MADLEVRVLPTKGRFAEVHMYFTTVDGRDRQTVYLPSEDARELQERMRPRLERHMIGEKR